MNESSGHGEAAKAVLSEVTKLRENVTSLRKDLISVNETLDIPICLRKMLIDTFRCTIRQVTPMKPPVIFACCCKSIVGCETCVDKWYGGEEGMTKLCPRCRAERSLPDTCRLCRLDDFLSHLGVILADPDSDD